MSEVIREKHWDWWLSTPHPLEPGGVVIVLMTRWHEGDLGGCVLPRRPGRRRPGARDPPAGARRGGRPARPRPGEALWPERYSARYLEHTRKVLGPYWFSAMYQGTPDPRRGRHLQPRDFRYFEIEGDEACSTDGDGTRAKRWGIAWCRKFETVDLAASEKETADYTVVCELWVTPERPAGAPRRARPDRGARPAAVLRGPPRRGCRQGRGQRRLPDDDRQAAAARGAAGRAGLPGRRQGHARVGRRRAVPRRQGLPPPRRRVAARLRARAARLPGRRARRPGRRARVSGRGHYDGFLQLEELNADLQGQATACRSSTACTAPTPTSATSSRW
jgi:hypothetical protein